MFKPLSYPTDMEIENLFSTLPDDTAKQLHDLVKQSRKEKPEGSGLNLSSKTPYVGSLERANYYVKGIIKHLWFHRQVIKNILGETFNGLFHADFYAAYSHLPNLQRCLIHYIRDIKKEIEIQPNETLQSFNKMILG